MTQMEILNDVKQDSLPRVSLKRMALTIMRHFLPFKKRTHLELLLLEAHYDLELHQMDVKTTLLNGDLVEEVYMD